MFWKWNGKLHVLPCFVQLKSVLLITCVFWINLASVKEYLSVSNRKCSPSPKSLQEKLVSWYFEPSQPLGIISGLKETFMKRYIYLKGPIRQRSDRENRVRNWRFCRENLWNSWKGHKDRNRYKNRIKRSGQARLVYVKNINRDISTTWRWTRGDL